MYYLRKTKGDWYFGKGRTSTYRGTVVSKNDAELLAMKADVKERNAAMRERTRTNIQRLKELNSPEAVMQEQIEALFNYRQLDCVRLFARGTRRDEDGKPLHSNADSNLQHKYAAYFDVYMLEDYKGQRAFQDRMLKQYCPNRYRKAEIEGKIQELNWELESLERNTYV